MNKASILLVAVIVALLSACSQTDPSPTPPPPTPIPGAFAKGADVSWVTELESKGIKFYNSNKQEMECMKLLQTYGINSIRLRVWVNPATKWNNIDDVLIKANRATKLGQRVMIDFHYSDTWADPGHQITPDAWKNYNITELKKAVYNHTLEMMNKLKAIGVEPEWVQVGNETRGGMLYPLGASDNGQNYADLTNSGYDAVKAVFPKSKVIVHLDSGQDLGLYKYLFDVLKTYGGKYDVIGMSLYPEPSSWKSTADKCIANIKTLNTTYGKKVMICEVGMSWDSAKESKDFLSYLIAQSKTNTNGSCLGVFYWEPEAEPVYNGYTKGCFSKGTPTIALDAFKE